MQISKESKNRYFYEYAYWSTIDAYNKSLEDKKNVIKTKEARVYRKKLEGILKKNAKEEVKGDVFAGLYTNAFAQGVNEVLRERVGYDAYTLTNGKYETLLQQRIDFAEMTSIDGKNTNLYGDDKYIPISPYDPRYSWRRAMLENGSKLSSIRVNDVENLDTFYKDYDLNTSTKVYSVPQKIKKDGKEIYIAEESKLNFLEKDDRSGLTMLMPYMTSQEYESVSEWVNRDLSDNVDDKDINNRMNNMKKAIKILRGLSDMGRDYEIVKDEYPGQIKANIKGTKLNVRLTEKKGTDEYIGSLYDDGVRYLFSTTRREANNKNRMHNPSPEDTLNLTRFALGEKVKREDSDKFVGQNEKLKRGAGKGSVVYNATYTNTTGMTAVYKNIIPNNESEINQEKYYNNKVRMIATTSARTNDTTVMNSYDDAEKYLRDTIDSARGAYLRALDVEGIIKQYEDNKDKINEFGDIDYTPNFDGDPNISVIQQSYWDVLTDKKDTLIKPSKDSEEIEEDFDLSMAVKMADNKINSYDNTIISKEEILRAHAKDSLEETIGNYDKGLDGLRFNPVGVSQFTESGYGVYRNNDDIVKAMTILNMNPDELKGDPKYIGVIKDRLIKFDEKSAKNMKDIDNPFIQTMYKEIYNSLESKGVTVGDVLLDENGVVQYKGSLASAERIKEGSKADLEFTGTIGQIFTPDEKGVVKTKYAGSENYAFVPGYTASIKFQVPGETKTMEERTILSGYEQKMIRGIRYQIMQDVLNSKGSSVEIGNTTSLNNVYRSIEGERYDVDFEKKYLEQGMEEDVLDAIIKTQSQRVRYPNEIRDGSSIHADFRAGQFGNFDYANDNYGDPYSITGNRNISVLSEESDGYFDPIATTSTSINQGAVRYLVDGVKVTSEGLMIPSEDKNARCAIFAHDITKFSEFDPYDRQCMTLSNISQANSVSKPVKSMDITLGSWTQDDAIVITKKFAESYPMRKADGSLRPLVIQDKLSDMHGNKGVVSYVLDTDKTIEDIKNDGLRQGFDEDKMSSVLKMYELAKKNPDVEVFMAPFTQPSRFNAGTAREKMMGISDGVDVDGNTVKGAVGEARFIITDKSVEAKTHIYDEEEILKGKGRKVSGQLAWSLTSKGSKAIMKEFFGPNNDNLINAREYLITMGLDISETGELSQGYKPHTGEERNVFKLPELKYTKTPKGEDRLDIKTMSQDFARDLSRKGGIIELPFALKYPTGEDIPPMDDGKRDVVYTKEQWERKGYTRKDGVYVAPTTVTRRIASSQRQTDNVTWGMPVLSAHLRSGQEFIDGTSMAHDYTNQYLNIYKEALRYIDNKNKYDKADSKAKAELETKMTMNINNAQDAYNSITKDIEKRKFMGKHNMFRDGIMARRVPNSATSVWSPDPRLNIDEIAVGVEMAQTLGIVPLSKEEQNILVWRDPILHDSNIRYMTVKVNPDISGCSINPNMDIPFDGDFDGDTVALVKLNSKEAQKEAKELFSVGANLVDTGHKITIDYKGEEKEVYPLNMNDGLDVQVARFYNKDLDDKWNELTIKANNLYEMQENGEVLGNKKTRLQNEMINELSDFYREAADKSFGKAQIRYDNLEDHVMSVYDANIKTGAKGSPSKLMSYAEYLGAKGVEFKDDVINLENLKDNERTLATREMQQGVMIATNVKNVGTGFAGSVSQRAIRTIGDIDPKVATELSYPATQSILQSKHDPVDAKRRFGLLMGPMRKIWDGKSLSYDEKNNRWLASKEQASPEEWKKSFEEFYTADYGMGVKINPEYVDKLTKAMTDEFTNTMKSVDANEEINNGKVEGRLLYKLAYGGTFENVVEAAQNNENLFEGNIVKEFTPFAVRTNLKAKELEVQGENYIEHKALTKSDTLVDGKERNVATIKPVSVNVRREAVNNISVGNDNDIEFE